jgi:anhydro-N-acetylmuramic acid kinase
MLPQKPELFIGLMSGTSLDGIDAALVAFNAGVPELLATHYQPFEPALKEALHALHYPAHDELHHAQLTGNHLATCYAAAVKTLLQTAKVTAQEIRAIGCHGQTIRHRPEAGYTVQLGNGALLAELSGITTICDFRSRDIAAGGHGAPLAPSFHDQVMRDAKQHRVIVNIGGISNLTDLPPGQQTTGFDCGPGNMLMDDWIKHHQDKPYDRDGAWAASGTVIPALLQRMLAEPFFAVAPPKSSGRDLFNRRWLEGKLRGDEMPVDVQATLLALTCNSIADAIERYCHGAQEIYLCGGGAHNGALRGMLGQRLPECLIAKTDALGIAADWVEAIAFAWLAHQTLHGLSANVPAVTGARHGCVLGAIYQA